MITDQQRQAARNYLESLRREQQANGASHDATAEWPEPVSLAPAGPPRLPLSIFPAPIAAVVDAVATEHETAIELPAANAIGVLSTAVQGKFQIEVKPPYSEQLNTYLAVFADSGEGKSAVQRDMIGPLIKYEADALANARARIARERSDHETLKARIKRLRDQLVKLNIDSAEFARGNDQLRAAEVALASKEIPHEPRLLVEDFTTEALGTTMAEQGECISCISDEAGPFPILAGKYNGGKADLDLPLKSFGGSPYRVVRIGRPSVMMNRPLLTICVSPQPSVIQSLRETSEFRGRGLLARFCFFLPRSAIGYRTRDTPCVPREVSDAYERAVRALLDIPRPAQPSLLKLTDEARADWKEFTQLVECELRPGGKFENIKDWGARAPGLAARIAGILHCAACAADEIPPDARLVGRDTMKRALDFTAVAVDHALLFFDAMGADAALDAARKVWAWIERERKAQFSFRDCFDALRGQFPRTQELEPAFEILTERYYVALKPPEARVGRPSRVYVVNSRLIARWEVR